MKRPPASVHYDGAAPSAGGKAGRATLDSGTALLRVWGGRNASQLRA